MSTNPATHLDVLSLWPLVKPFAEGKKLRLATSSDERPTLMCFCTDQAIRKLIWIREDARGDLVVAAVVSTVINEQNILQGIYDPDGKWFYAETGRIQAGGKTDGNSSQLPENRWLLNDNQTKNFLALLEQSWQRLNGLTPEDTARIQAINRVSIEKKHSSCSSTICHRERRRL